MGEDNPARKVYKSNIYSGKRRRGRCCLIWSKVKSQQSLDIELVELKVNRGGVPYKVILDWTTVGVSLMTMIRIPPGSAYNASYILESKGYIIIIHPTYMHFFLAAFNVSISSEALFNARSFSIICNFISSNCC